MISPVQPERIPRAMMHKDEHPMFVRSIEEALVRGGHFIEIGTRRGNGLRAIFSVMKERNIWRRVISIDPAPVLHRVRSVVEEFPEAEHSMIEDRSDLVKTEDVGVRDAAWVYVDGCHCFECCRLDIDRFGRELAPGSILAIHDINTGLHSTVTYNSQQYCYRMGAATVSAVWPVIQTSEVLNLDYELVERGGEIDGFGYWRRK